MAYHVDQTLADRRVSLVWPCRSSYRRSAARLRSSRSWWGILLFAAFKWSLNVRNLLGIRKDHIELQKTSLELDRLKSPIRLANDEEVERYGIDKRIVGAARRYERRIEMRSGQSLLLALVVSAGIVALTVLEAVGGLESLRASISRIVSEFLQWVARIA